MIFSLILLFTLQFAIEFSLFYFGGISQLWQVGIQVTAFFLPCFIALFFARREGLVLRVRGEQKWVARSFYLGLVLSAFLATVVYFLVPKREVPLSTKSLITLPLIFGISLLGFLQSEYYWRGYLWKKLSEKFPSWQVALLTGALSSLIALPILFLLGTGAWWIKVPLGMIAGLVIGYFRLKSGGILPGALIATLLVTTLGGMGLFFELADTLKTDLFILFSYLGVIGALGLYRPKKWATT